MNRREFFQNAFKLGFAGIGAALVGGRLEEAFAEGSAGEPELVAVRGGEPDVMFDAAIREFGGMGRFVKKGQTVSQGQNIGTVGATGWATGPHLHFEFRVDGQHQDPMVIARQSEAAAPVSAAARPAFDRLASTMRIELSSAALIEQASAE